MSRQYDVFSWPMYNADIAVDFALIEAAYAVVRILQRFPNIRVPADGTYEKTGKKRQTLTLVLLIGDGCKVQME